MDVWMPFVVLVVLSSSPKKAAFFSAGADAVGLTDTGLAEGLKIAQHYRALHRKMFV